MKIKANIKIEYKDSKDAEISYKSLKVDDDEGYAESTIKDNIIDYTITSDSLGSFLATSDDLIASEILVEKVLDKSQK
ncbi:MAG: hypothetical protein K1X33_09045 [Methanobacteriaceae archaeon]|jgi:hypothetical protein|nr:hypothetical protein [Methanobacteriaceae archaeon]